jgi:hypothetical protein
MATSSAERTVRDIKELCRLGVRREKNLRMSTRDVEGL